MIVPGKCRDYFKLSSWLSPKGSSCINLEVTWCAVEVMRCALEVTQCAVEVTRCAVEVALHVTSRATVHHWYCISH